MNIYYAFIKQFWSLQILRLQTTNILPFLTDNIVLLWPSLLTFPSSRQNVREEDIRISYLLVSSPSTWILPHFQTIHYISVYSGSVLISDGEIWLYLFLFNVPSLTWKEVLVILVLKWFIPRNCVEFQYLSNARKIKNPVQCSGHLCHTHWFDQPNKN